MRQKNKPSILLRAFMCRCGIVLPTHSLCVCFLQIALGSSNHQRVPPPSASTLAYQCIHSAVHRIGSSLTNLLLWPPALHVGAQGGAETQEWQSFLSHAQLLSTPAKIRLSPDPWGHLRGQLLPAFLVDSLKNFWRDWHWQIGCRVIVAVLHASTTTHSSKTQLTSPS